MKYSTTSLIVTFFISGSLLFPITAQAVAATDLDCTGCVGTRDIANVSVTNAKLGNNAVNAAKISDGSIINADINATAGIDPTKISGTAWTATNDGLGTGLDADLLDGIDSSLFLRNDMSGTLAGSLSMAGSVGIGGASLVKALNIAAGSNDAIYITSDASDDWYVGPNVVTLGFGIYDVTQAASRFHIDMSGNVGIGIASPSNNLDLVSTGNTKMLIHANDATNDRFPELELQAGNSDAGAYSILKFSKTAGSATEKLQIQNGSGTSVITVNGDGNVGIGTTTPSRLLQLSGTASDIGLRLEGTATGADYYLYSGVGGSDKFGIYDEDAGVDRLVVDSSGNIGIGTITPTNLLDLVSTGNTKMLIHANDAMNDRNPELELEAGNTDAGGHSIIKFSKTAGTTAEQLQIQNGSGSDILTVDGNGSVGVGTTTPDTTLDVNGSVTISNTLYGPSSTSLTLQSASSRAIVINTDGANERMRITNDGYVGVGTASPTATVTISSTASVDLLRANDDGDSDTTPFYISGGGRVGIGTTDNTDNKVHMVWDESGGTTLVAENTSPDASNTTGIQGIVYASGDGASGQPVGVRGDAEDNSPSEGQYGVVGYNWATNQTSGLQGAGVFGGSLGTPGSEAEYTGRGHGVQGETYASNDNSAGGIFYSRHTTGEANAITGLTYSTDADSYSFQGSGPTSTTGTKSAIVNTASQGPTELYVMESPEVWFEDIGEGKLVNGQVTIQLDPIFLETITINDQHPLQVFIEPYANVDLYVERGQNSFTVKTRDNSTSNASFGYRVVAKRKHYEDQRLRKAKVPIDQFMEPGLTMDQLYKLNEQWGLGEAFQDLFLMHPSMTAKTDFTVNVDTNP